MAKSGSKGSPAGIAAGVEKLVKPALEALGLCLWDLRFEKEGALWLLRVLIERGDGAPMDTDTCEAASRAIDPILDEADPIEQSYCLEVGSPGLGRTLYRPRHFAAWLGKKVRVRLYAANEAGRKEVCGILTRFEDETAALCLDGEELLIPLGEAAQFKACDDEDLF